MGRGCKPRPAAGGLYAHVGATLSALAAFTDGIQRTLRRPADENLIWLAVAAILIGGWLMRRFLVNPPARGGGS